MNDNRREEEPPQTIWQKLEAWAQGFLPWQKFALSYSVRFARLTDTQIDQAYTLFLYDNGLAEKADPSIEIPSAITGLASVERALADQAHTDRQIYRQSMRCPQPQC